MVQSYNIYINKHTFSSKKYRNEIIMKYSELLGEN